MLETRKPTEILEEAKMLLASDARADKGVLSEATKLAESILKEQLQIGTKLELFQKLELTVLLVAACYEHLSSNADNDLQESHLFTEIYTLLLGKETSLGSEHINSSYYIKRAKFAIALLVSRYNLFTNLNFANKEELSTYLKETNDQSDISALAEFVLQLIPDDAFDTEETVLEDDTHKIPTLQEAVDALIGEFYLPNTNSQLESVPVIKVAKRPRKILFWKQSLSNYEEELANAYSLAGISKDQREDVGAMAFRDQGIIIIPYNEGTMAHKISHELAHLNPGLSIGELGHILDEPFTNHIAYVMEVYDYKGTLWKNAYDAAIKNPFRTRNTSYPLEGELLTEILYDNNHLDSELYILMLTRYFQPNSVDTAKMLKRMIAKFGIDGLAAIYACSTNLETNSGSRPIPEQVLDILRAKKSNFST